MYLSSSAFIALLVAALSFVFSMITRGTGLLSSAFDLVTLLALAVVVFKAVQAGLYLYRHHSLLRVEDSSPYPLHKEPKSHR